MNFLQEAIVYLAAVVLSVSLFKRLGLGSVLGYLAAGMLLGPDGFNVVGDVNAVMHFGELGVHFLLFIVGLELQPARLWQMRRQVFGLGGAQVGLTTLLLGCCAYLCGLDVQQALLVGVALSLSSTAFALQLLGERNALGRPHGQAAFAVLLFQDLATIVLLAALPLLARGLHPGGSVSAAITVAKTLGVLALLIGSRWLLRPALRFIAALHVHEVFTAASLLVVIAFSQIVDAIGLSMALGAFLAGMLFADSEYRHALEADIEPFKGLLLGLFFMAVGMTVQLELLLMQPITLLALVIGLLAVKAAVLTAISWWRLRRGDESIRFAITIGQGGEFAFVIFSQAVARGTMPQHLNDMLIAVVTLSMAATPLLLASYERGLWPTPRGDKGVARAPHVSPTEDPSVIISGFGRVGQITGRILKAMGIPFTALDTNPEHIDFITKFGNKVFYGDAARVDMLRAARADKAQVFVLCISDAEASLRCARSVMAHFPHLTIVARARNRDHAYQLMQLGIDHVIRETFYSSLVLTRQVLQQIGLTFTETQAAIERFQEHDEQLMAETAGYHDDPEQMQAAAKQARRELRSLFEEDRAKPAATGAAAAAVAHGAAASEGAALAAVVAAAAGMAPGAAAGDSFAATAGGGSSEGNGNGDGDQPAPSAAHDPKAT